jgi:hypothetical protein
MVSGFRNFQLLLKLRFELISVLGEHEQKNNTKKDIRIIPVFLKMAFII